MSTYRSPDGLSYKLRNCNTGRERRALVHSNRLKSYNDDRDTFYNRHNNARPVSQNNTETYDGTTDGTTSGMKLKRSQTQSSLMKQKLF